MFLRFFEIVKLRIYPFFLMIILAGCNIQSVSTYELPKITFEPDLHTEKLPDFASIKDIKVKKAAFFNYLMPAVKALNSHIMTLRTAALKLRNKHLNKKEVAWLGRLAKKYRIQSTPKDGKVFWNELNRKVDIVPPSLALAQAANESSWGTSRFARVGNNLFGQWCFTSGCGIVPMRRNEGSTHEVSKFNNVFDSVRSYIHNLNINTSYTQLRTIRANLRAGQEPIKGTELVKGLINYSAKGQDYIAIITQIIKKNKLEHWEG